MSSSLRDQLLKAGLVTEKQVRQANQQQRQQDRKKTAPAPEVKRAAQQAHAQKAARDQELNRQHQEKAERKARTAAIRQLIEQNRLPRIESEDRFNFIDRGKVRYLAVDAARREKLNSGELAIVRYGDYHAVVPAETAARIRERDAQVVVPLNAAPTESKQEDDPYKGYEVPDDLMW